MRLSSRKSTEPANSRPARNARSLAPTVVTRLPVAQAPRRLQTVSELCELQRLAFSTFSHPLGRDGQPHAIFSDGRSMAEVAAQFIKPNARMTSLERLALYNRQYWFRLLDVLWDDYPGLRAILGLRKFEKLRIAYLIKFPSRSFTLRNLGSRLAEFLQERPDLTAPNHEMCMAMARFEWAQVVAFDGQARKPLTVNDLIGQNPTKLRLELQPYITLLELEYPLDDFVLAVKNRDAAMRSEASNAVETDRKEKEPPRPRLPKRATTYLAVHRFNNDLYYKQLERPEYQILAALHDGKTLSEACDLAISANAADNLEWTSRIQQWFQKWAAMGWFFRRAKS